VKYGIVKNNYILLKDSVPGPKKRTVLLRTPVRKQTQLVKEPQILYISTESQQG
jgi:large subunit ribosomal protein L3